ncbi:MAG: hypothetical protein WC099_01195 [Candidatus Paceibacterota bacterium]
MLYGYDNTIASLKKLADQGDLSHAYIFFGEPQVGKFLCAKILANYLENKELCEPSRMLQETLIIDIAQQDTEGDSESIGIEVVRRVTYFLHQKPVLSQYRTVIIRDGEWLTDQAQNALLKTLEEPPQQSLIILIATDTNVFLPAVSSRAQKIYFKTLSNQEVLDFYNSSGIIKDTSLVGKSFGRIGRLKSFIEPTKRDQIIDRFVQDICAPKKSDIVREKLVDAIIAFDQKNPTHLLALCEALMIQFRSQGQQEALIETIRLITHIQTITLSKRIHLKKLLCLIN